MPLIYAGVAFSPRFMGKTMAEFCADPEIAVRAQLDTMKHFAEFDGCQTAGAASPPSLAAGWLSRVKVPGKELPDDQIWQVEETETMSPADYDLIIDKGWSSFFESYLPRVVDMDYYTASVDWSARNRARVKQLYREYGFVIFCDCPLLPTIPLERLSGGRSFQQFILDLYRIPGKVEAAMKVIQEETLEKIGNLPEAAPDMAGGSWIGGLRSASALLAPKLWERFVWPYYVQIVEALVGKGYTPVLHWDHDWTRDLARLKELPAKKVVLNTDGMTDVRKFRDIVGMDMSLMGDVPASLFSHGTPEELYGYVRGLVRDLGTTGLLLCPGCDAPINTKPENMAAFVAAGLEFGS